jgi:hypothetical protein
VALLSRNYLLAVILLIVAATSQAFAQERLQLAEQEIKAGLLYNFLKYTQWPPSRAGNPASNIVVCVLKEDPFADFLKPMEGRSVNQKEIALRVVHDAGDVQTCHLIFIGAGEKEDWPKLREGLGGKNVLTVGDFDGFAEMGGMIEFGRLNNHIRVNLNIDAVAAAQLQVEDRLLRLVTIVHPHEMGGK